MTPGPTPLIDNMDNNYISLLRLINSNVNIESIIKYGLSYSQLAILISKGISNNHVQITSNGVTLTSLGIEKVQQAGKDYRQGFGDALISPDEKHRVEKISLETLYIPSAKSIAKLKKWRTH